MGCEVLSQTGFNGSDIESLLFVTSVSEDLLSRNPFRTKIDDLVKMKKNGSSLLSHQNESLARQNK